MRPQVEKLLTFVCGIVGCVYATRAALHVTRDLILAAVIGCLVGSFIGGAVAGLIQVTIDEPENLIYAGVGIFIVLMVKLVWGKSMIGWLFAW